MIVVLTQWLDEERGDPTAQKPTAQDSTIQGAATVVDGDTIRIDDRRIRFYGVDAPEMDQFCRNAEKQRFACGKSVKTALSRKIDGRLVTCRQVDLDQYQRVIATCSLENGEELNAWLVEKGLAMAYLDKSASYAALERVARSRKVGLWAGTFEPPWQWRKRRH